MSVSTPFLHTIQPVSEDRPAEAVAREILALIRSEYRSRGVGAVPYVLLRAAVIEDFFVPNIRHHIHVNHFFMSYIIQQFAGLPHPGGTVPPDPWTLLSLMRIWAVSGGKCVCRRQMPTVDLADYLAGTAVPAKRLQRKRVT